MIKFVSLSWFLRFYHFYGLFMAYLLYEEVMSVRLYVKGSLKTGVDEPNIEHPWLILDVVLDAGRWNRLRNIFQMLDIGWNVWSCLKHYIQHTISNIRLRMHPTSNILHFKRKISYSHFRMFCWMFLSWNKCFWLKYC